jgi:hypothetical protein
MAINYDYYPLKISEDHWIIYKVDDLHGKLPDKTYHIQPDWTGKLFCDCKASGRCKHLLMIQPKKELF